MEDPNRPLTVYPAPNPNPNPNPNGYSTNPPPPTGTAYPYAAAPPPPNNYNYQSNPYYNQNYQPNYDAGRRATCLRRILSFVIGLVIVFAVFPFIVWLVLRPQLPEFRVDSFSISNFTIANSSLVFFTSEIGLTARNPNKKISLAYHIEAVVFYKSESLAKTMIPPFSQGTRNETALAARFAADGSFVDSSMANGISSERGRDGNVEFNLRMLSRVRFWAKAWRTRSRFLKVFCGNLVVGIPINGRTGALTGGPRQCRVGI